MMPRHALRVSVDGEPTVLSHPGWTWPAIEAALDGPAEINYALALRPRSKHWLLLVGRKSGEPNPAAERLGAPPARGPILVFSMSDRTGLVADMSERELFVLSTHLLVGEFRQALTTSDPHRIAAGAGLATPPIQGGTA